MNWSNKLHQIKRVPIAWKLTLLQESVKLRDRSLENLFYFQAFDETRDRNTFFQYSRIQIQYQPKDICFQPNKVKTIVYQIFF